ncbi:DUF3987 domain-containing protein [Duganella vulcania]|uniref:DUF3987 domain-containing protein n=1 Tax=Duganella vulcania TaxID=2692166 RepID=A0A845GTT7_9BURK|nr:DUF3987 domain-containing protein [Duganella vulcania]MYM97903.1 DUF3987 domain-containing protein [Duganella vulcania]
MIGAGTGGQATSIAMYLAHKQKKDQRFNGDAGKLDFQIKITKALKVASDVVMEGAEPTVATQDAAVTFLSPLFANIPLALRNEARWVAWRAEGPTGQKPIKMPYDPSLPQARAKVDDPTSWGTFSQAVAAFEEGGYTGIGIVLDGSGLVGIDLDNCVVNGKIDPAAQMLLDSVGATYIELSPSGTGLRAFGYAENLSSGVNREYNGLKVEMYSRGRYLTVTGHYVENGAVGPLLGFSELADRIRGDKTANPQTREFSTMAADKRQAELIRNILSGEVYHDSIRDLIASLVANGLRGGAVVNMLYALMDTAAVTHDERWVARRAEIPRLVASAEQKFAPEPPLLVLREPTVIKQNPSAGVPPHLLTIPGVLGDMVNWVNQTSSKPQPYFAVQAALAFGSVVMGRKFCTTQRNWTNLYFLNIAVSGGGKEHAKTVIEECLRAAGLQQLIGASEYTSDAAIDSLLLDKPTHISIIDEFGLLLEAGNAKNNHNGGTARKRLMEMFGRSHSTLTPKAYSMAGLSKDMREKQRNRFVENPSLTVLGMTTPDTFYNAVGTGSLKDGFLNRFIMVISDLGRQPSQDVDYVEPPESVIQWAKACRIRGAGDIAETQIDTQHDTRPQPITVPFDAAATRLFKQLDIQCIERMDELEEQGLCEMYSRVREISMKVSLMVAHSCGSDTITAEHAQWAIDYVRYWADRAIVVLGTKVADNPFASLCNDVASIVKEAGAKGATVPEIARKSSKFKGADGRLRDNVFRNLESDRGIKLYNITHESGRGAKRAAYVAPEFADQQH